MIIPKNSTFWDYNFKFHRMIDMYRKYDNMNKTGIVYTLICINNHIIISINYMLSPSLVSRVRDREIFHHDTSLSPLFFARI